ncbi:MAG: alkaline phosphatase D family protein [Burkholderiales bacterium]|nr:alkaline phosphatase D family protein [Burkholderiales bacterium]
MSQPEAPDAGPPRDPSASPPDTAPITRRQFARDGALYAAGLGLAGAGLSGCGGGTTPEGTFGHGVASGDPLADRVVLWTRVTQGGSSAIEVGWELARDAQFSSIVASGRVSTSAARDFTVHVDAGGLQPGTAYHYRFRFRDELSPVGRTRTLPAGAVSQARLAVFSCAAYPVGQFHAYADAARRGDIDAAVLLGDYIYESDLSRGLELASRLLGRNWEPDRELITLEDYRARHGFYRGDIDLKALHAAMPVIAVWDDHDLINGIWRDGANAHDPSKGSFSARRAAAMQAFQEWLPIRLPDPAAPARIYRRFDIGSLATLHMLDARAIGRDAQASRAEHLSGATASPTRQMLGAEQSAWLLAGLQGSAATWQLLGSQVWMARMHLPLSVLDNFSEDTISAFLAAQATAPAARSDTQRALVAQPRAPFRPDTWDGYPAAREAVLSTARQLGKNLVVLAGDSHNAWASDLKDASGAAVGVEFATTSVTSAGLELEYPRIGRQFLADAFVQMVPELRYAQTSDRGYLLVTLTPARARADWVFVGSVFANELKSSIGRSLATRPGADGRRLEEA